MIGFAAASVAALVFWSIVKIYSASASDGQFHVEPDNGKKGPPVTKPTIIWFHSGAGYSLESLKTAISSGLITHVMLTYMHRADADWKTNADVRKAIEMVKKSDVKLIWGRNLWPYYANKNIKLTDIFDPNYYAREIYHLRAEGKEMGADFVAFDTEPYADSPMKLYLKGEKRIRLTAMELQRLELVIKEVARTTGKVDFVFPAGSLDWQHPYNILAGLGQSRIAENTYYANEKTIKAIKYPYEIFGAYVNTIRKRPENPDSPYFLVSDILDNSQLWSKRKGLFLYTDKEKVRAVAKELVAYANSLPRVSPVQPQKSDSSE